MGNVRIINAGDRYSSDLELESGDSVLVASTEEGTVLFSLDDVDDSVVPTGRLTPEEADRIALMLQSAARRARRIL